MLILVLQRKGRHPLGCRPPFRPLGLKPGRHSVVEQFGFLERRDHRSDLLRQLLVVVQVDFVFEAGLFEKLGQLVLVHVLDIIAVIGLLLGLLLALVVLLGLLALGGLFVLVFIVVIRLLGLRLLPLLRGLVFILVVIVR